MVSCIHYFSCKIILFHYALLHKAGIWSLTKKAFTQGHMLICIQVLAVKKVMTTLILLNLRVTLERKDIRQKKSEIKLTHILKIKRFYCVLLRRISVRFKVTDVQNIWSG